MADAQNLPSLPPAEDALEELLQAGWRKSPESFGPYPQFKRIMEKVFETTNEEAAKTLSKGAREALHVSCFSERKDSIRMWSLYADQHRGICLEYETLYLSLPTVLGWLHPVNYHPEMFDATDYFRNYSGDYNNWMLWIAACHKSPEWADEREWRIVDVSFRDRVKVSPKSIILGVNILPEIRAAVTEIARNHDISILEESLDPTRFQLRFGGT